VRKAVRETNVESLLAEMELDKRVHEGAARRLTGQTERYSLLIRTTIGNDVRQRYVICAASASFETLLDWEVAP